MNVNTVLGGMDTSVLPDVIETAFDCDISFSEFVMYNARIELMRSSGNVMAARCVASDGFTPKIVNRTPSGERNAIHFIPTSFDDDDIRKELRGVNLINCAST